MHGRYLLEKSAEVDIQTVNKELLIDASQIILDYTVPKEQRINMLINEIKNPTVLEWEKLGLS